MDIVFSTPILQRSRGGFGLECVPLVQTAFLGQELFEARVSTPMAKEPLDPRILVGQFLRGEVQSEAAAELKIILVWYGEVSV